MKLDKFTVGKRYAKAIFELACEKDCLEAIKQQMDLLAEIVEKLPELPQLLSDVRLTMPEKKQVLDVLLKGFSGYMSDFLAIVFEYNRMQDVLFIIDEFNHLYDEQNGIVEGTVTTAVPLEKEKRAKIEAVFARRIGYQTAKLKNIVDPTIQGGVITEGNHRVVDGSVRTQLEEIKEYLAKI